MRTLRTVPRGERGSVLVMVLWIAFGLVGSYAFAWAGHFKIENNVPLTFKHPLWSLIADYRMFFLWMSGRLGQHLVAAGVGAKG